MKKVLLGFGLVLAIFACEKEEPAPVTPELVPKVSEFSPASGPVGTEVTVKGENFAATNAENEVYFVNGAAETSATILSSAATNMKVKVPEGLQSGEYTILLKTRGYEASSAKKFTVTESVPENVPAITSFSPALAYAGESFSISGTNFSAEVEGNLVSLLPANGEAVALVVEPGSTTSLEVKLPDNLAAGEYTVVVKVGDQTASSTDKFTVLQRGPVPVISGSDPETVIAGNSVVLSGSNFGATIEDNQVNLVQGSTTIAATVISASATSLEISIPSGTPAGMYTIQVKAAGSIGNSSFELQVTEPHTISSFSPQTQEKGGRIVISGTNFSTSLEENEVKFYQDGVTFKGKVIEATSTSLTVQIPELFNGSFYVEVTVNGFKVRATEKFTLGAFSTPVVSAVSATTVKKGEQITITGSNFSYDSEVIYVVLVPVGTNYRKYATQISVSPTEIVAEIPSSFVEGEYVLEIHKGANKGTAPSNISVIP